MIALRLNRRRDGSLCLTDAQGSGSSPARAFPEQHGFTYEWLARNGGVAKIDGDTLTLTLANASAVYTVTERRPDGCDVKLESAELFDAPPIDEKKAAAVVAASDDSDVMVIDSGSVANAGSVLVDEEA